MSFNPSSKKYAPKKTYGKASHSRYNMHGRELWTEKESEESIARIHREAQTKREKKRKDRIADFVEDVGPRHLETNEDVDSVTDHLLSLSLSKSASVQTASGTSVTATITKKMDMEVDGNTAKISRNSSTSTLASNSDKENEPSPPSPPSPEQLKTPSRGLQARRVTPIHLTPVKDSPTRGVLGEKPAEEVVESPLRKHGLRKRSSMISSSGAGPSPLRRQTPSKARDTTTSPSPIPVWDDDLQDVIVIKTDSPAPRSPRPELRQPEAENGRSSNFDVIKIESPNIPSPMEKELTETEPEMASEESIAPPFKLDDLTDLSKFSTPEPEEHVSSTKELLKLCNAHKVVDFSAHMNYVERDAVINKLGEASYSEVFLQTPTDCEQEPIVLKIIPFGKEEQCEISQIIQEIRITKAMGEIEGYIGFRGAYVTRGFFPDILMDEWDLYDEEYGSENERPDFYDEDQLFAIIMLEMGGSDLEHTDLYGWEDSFDVFYQTAVALARGEKRRQFEHRDLHFGNIVIRRKPQVLPTRKKQKTPTSDKSDPSALLENLSLSTPSAPRESNLKVAMIDYTLSRAHCGPSSNPSEFIEFAPLDDPALFTGKGNYQFDIYRFMKNHVTSLAPCASDGSDDPEEKIEWNVFAPMTNVFWLHYLTDILTNKKGIPRPAARGRFKTSEEEKDFYRKLETVGRRINPRKKILDAGKEIGSAVELVEWAVKEGLFPEVDI